MTDIYYREIPTDDPRLGRNVYHDPRSRLYAYHAPRHAAFVSKRHNRFIPVLDQGSLGSCTGNTGLGACGTAPFYDTLDEIVDDWSQSVAVSIYSDATKIDPFTGTYPPTDTGSNGLSVAKVLKSRGWISGYKHIFSSHDLKGALQEGPVMLGINWYSSFYHPESDGQLVIKPGASVSGGHEILIDEIDMENERYWITNSWGRGWGEEGRAYFTFETMDRLLREDGDLVVLVPITEPAPEPTPSEPEVVEEDTDLVDEALWNVAKHWIFQRHPRKDIFVAKALYDWARSKGLT